jgi:hypothetical protein
MGTDTYAMPGQGMGKMNPWLPMVVIAMGFFHARLRTSC